MKKLLPEVTQHLNGPVLLTGHTGFKGTWMTLLLEELGVEVVGVSLPPEDGSLFSFAQRGGKIKEYFVDIRELQTVEKIVNETKPSAVIHFAAQSLVLNSYEHIHSTFSTNVMGTANVLEASLKSHCVKAIIVATTDKVYLNQELKQSFKENDSLKGTDPYSCSKVGAEAVVAGWRQYVKNFGGPQITSVRSGNVIGGGDTAKNRLLPDLVRGLSAQSQITIRNPDSTRPWQHVLDPLFGYLLTLNKLLSNQDIEAMNFGPTKEVLTVKEVVEIACASWSNSTKIEYLKENSSLETSFLQLDSTLASNTLGWEPFYSQENAVKSTMNWWKEYLTNQKTASELSVKEIRQFLTR
jgi:CDP-glucose 4,6-dehydratase